MILGADGEKMSKSRGNVINPNELVEKYGADALLHNFFVDYREAVLTGIRNQEIEAAHYEMVVKVNICYENIKLNLVVSSLMEFINKCYQAETKFMPTECFLDFLKLLNPLAPHIAEEIKSPWPHPEKLPVTAPQKAKIVIQINGQKKVIISAPKDLNQKEVEELAKNDPQLSKLLVGQTINKVIFISNKLINFVIN
ncbi:9413_t:CDS:2 [Racocetra fulgida]|uniref:leucine--tRNA ligase n=1 Tax=Racocetra fulgida TaxID=60492 RepID=A0A9N8VDR5_9GLOM|nr:9413_t:CDS:2 [Racocetra fulgida]